TICRAKSWKNCSRSGAPRTRRSACSGEQVLCASARNGATHEISGRCPRFVDTIPYDSLVFEVDPEAEPCDPRALDSAVALMLLQMLDDVSPLLDRSVEGSSG